ncbi:MAG TPA: ABC transporter permease [Ktedonobacteraceae bacterium]|jgi:ABC-2 type transport system permease protein|nr:ABC transporter permease [Ktedonobacteraceae bacterium]
MKAIWYIAKKDLLLTLKDKSSFFFMLAMPIIFITVMGLVLGNSFGGNSGPIQVTIAISNHDNGPVGKAILDAFKTKTSGFQFNLKNYSDPNQVVNIVADSKNNVDAGVIIPVGTSDALTNAVENHQPVNNLVKFYALPGSNNAPALYAQGIVNGVINDITTDQYASMAAVGQVNHVCHAPGNTCASATIDPQAIGKAVVQSLTSTPNSSPVQALTAGQAVTVSSFDLYVPGYAIFFALFGLNAVAGTILQEKEDGTFRRLLIAPVQKYALLGGKVLAQFILTVLQIAVLFVFGYVFFHIHIGNLLAVSLLILATAFAITGLGIALVSIVKTRRQLAPVVSVVTLVSASIGGVFFPAWLMPSWMQQISKIGLPSWAMEGLNNVMIYGKDLNYVLPDILGLVVYGLICYIIALRFFRFQEKAA